MIKNGLLQEIRELYEYARTSADLGAGRRDEHDRNNFTVGVFQSIGYKEFYEFISDPDVSEGKFADAVEQTKHSTRKYAKRQVEWLQNELLPAIRSVTAQCRGKSSVAALYLLDTTGKLAVGRKEHVFNVSSLVLGESRVSNVLQPAKMIMNAFLNEEELPDPTTLSPLARAILTDVNKALRSVVVPTLTDLTVFPSPSAVLEARRKVVCPL
ncbi:hypothetical protein PISMIDRAFT_366861 [Pisolithus microcarpus 441]|uniref:tRNA dimethylallyltransferase n=1 Tax=Pisolithus microcarpus 441 TaxID=765257 RepID=A0A0C9Z6S0_9AGAM|nr:hypothetical protein PISMIDRAFT_366861 [Pisolithus microcarpus 441]